MHFERNNINTDPFLFQMVNPMQNKFNKYWANIAEMHCIASILDPRYKIAFLTHMYNHKMNLSCFEAEEKLALIKSKLVLFFLV